MFRFKTVWNYLGKFRSLQVTIKNLLAELLCRICTVQIQPRKYVLDHADYTAPTRQHERDPTDQEFIYLPSKI